MRLRTQNTPSASRLAALALAATVGVLALAATGGAADTRQSVVEAETMAVPSTGVAKVYDTNASAGAAVVLWNNRTATAVVSGTLRAVTIRVRATVCEGPPQVSVVVDGTLIGVRDVSSASWVSYKFAVPQTGTSKRHVVSITYLNDRYTPKVCDRNLYLDRVIGDVDVTAVPSTPAVTPSTIKPVEAERLTPEPAGIGTAREDITAYGESSMLLWNEGTIDDTINAPSPVTMVSARVKGDQCAGAPQARLSVDGVAYGRFQVYWSNWATVQVYLKAPLPAGRHKVAVSYINNATGDADCDRNLRIDWLGINVPGSDLRPPPLEAETLSLAPSTAGATVTDGTASSGKSVQVWSNGAVSTTMKGSVFNIVAKVKGSQCGGSPKASISVDGTVYATFDVFWTGWASYPVKFNTPLAGGTHTITVSYVNDAVLSACDRKLQVDWLGYNLDLSYLTRAPVKPSDTSAPVEIPSSGGGSDPSGRPKLKWAAPAMTNPTTLRLGTQRETVNLDTTKDYILQLPATPKASMTVKGGRNVIIVGGTLTLDGGAALYIDSAVGTVHIEGLLIDEKYDGEGDGISIRAPKAIVQIQNTRVVNISGSEAGVHGDIIQAWGGTRELRIDRFTGSTGCQGLFLRPDVAPNQKMTLSRIDLNYNNNKVNEGGDLLFLTTGCEMYPTTLSEVYIGTAMEWLTPGTSAFPKPWTEGCPATVTSSSISWPSLPITGKVTLGKPAGGEFVPAGAAGIGYTSPGA